MKKIISCAVGSIVTFSSYASDYGENRAWQFPTADESIVKMQRMQQIAGLKAGTLSASSWTGAGGPIGNNVTINYVINGDNNTISGNTNNIDQENNGDQQGILNKDGDIINIKNQDENKEPIDNAKD